MEKTVEYSGNFTPMIFKIVLFGPESTGKTTLAKELAIHYKTSWVPEYMREYLEEKWKTKKETIVREDLIPIAKGQLEQEKKQSEKANKLLICDTNLLELKVYSEYYYNGYCPDFINEKATKNEYDIYLLTYVDVPWEADRLRDRPENREEMFLLFKNELEKYNFPYVVMKGNREERLNKAIQVIDDLIAKKKKKNI